MLLSTIDITFGKMILSFSLVMLIFLAVLYIIYLRGIKKHDKVLFTLCDFRRSIMELMRSERFTSDKILKEDYKELKYMLDSTNNLITIYSKRYASAFHISNFMQFIKVMYQQASEIEEKQKKAQWAKNEEIKHLQNVFARMVPWMVITHLPTLFKTFLLALIPPVLIAKAVGSTTTIANDFKNWVLYQVKDPLKKNFNSELI